MECMKRRLTDNLDLHGVQPRLCSHLVRREDLGFTRENLREEHFTILDDAIGGFLGFHLSSKGNFEMFLKVPLQAFFFLFRERIMNSNIIFQPLVEADFRLKDAPLLEVLLDPYQHHPTPSKKKQ